MHHLAKTLVSLADSTSQSFCVHGSSTRAGCEGVRARTLELLLRQTTLQTGMSAGKSTPVQSGRSSPVQGAGGVAVDSPHARVVMGMPVVMGMEVVGPAYE